jgi:uncharacterized membrane protein
LRETAGLITNGPIPIATWQFNIAILCSKL